MAGFYFPHLVVGDIHDGLNNRPFRGCHHNFLILVVKCRPDSPRVTNHKRISMPDQSGNGIAPVPVLRRSLQQVADVQVFLNQGGNLPVGIPFILILPEKQLVFFIQKMPYFFKHGDCIGIGFRMLPKVNQFSEQFVGIGEVEVARQHQIPRFPVVLPHHGVNEFNAVAPEGSIPQMPQK